MLGLTKIGKWYVAQITVIFLTAIATPIVGLEIARWLILTWLVPSIVLMIDLLYEERKP